MEGNRQGAFRQISARQSGFHADGDTRSVAIVNWSGRPLILVSVNQGLLKSFKVNSPGESQPSVGSIINLQKNDAHALVTFIGGDTRKIEFSYGSGCLSQSSRILSVPDSASLIEIFAYKGNWKNG